MRVLLIEDDEVTSRSIELFLGEEGYSVDATEFGEEGLDLGRVYDYDVIVLDLNLPDVSGYDVLRQLRDAKVESPVLILSGLSDSDDKVKGLGIGADDYLTKPFDKREMMARLKALIRRAQGHSQAVVKVGALEVDLTDRTASINDKVLNLTGKEFAMLELLALRRGSTLSKEMFLNHLYGGMDEPELKIIDVFICKLRKKIAKANNGNHYIETVWGRGYVLRESAEEEAA